MPARPKISILEENACPINTLVNFSMSIFGLAGIVVPTSFCPYFDVIFHALHDYFLYQENMHTCNSHNLYLLYMNFSILRKRCAEYVNKVRLVKACMYIDKIICIV